VTPKGSTVAVVYLLGAFCSHLLSAVLQRVTGVTALDFARKRLFEPLGVGDVGWDSDPQGRSIGSAALQMRALDMTKLGSMYLTYGKFETHRILDREWVEKSLTTRVKMPTAGGPAEYGYYWWLYPERTLFEALGGRRPANRCIPRSWSRRRNDSRYSHRHSEITVRGATV